MFLRLAKKVCVELVTVLYQLFSLLGECAYRLSVAPFGLSSHSLNGIRMTPFGFSSDLSNGRCGNLASVSIRGGACVRNYSCHSAAC